MGKKGNRIRKEMVHIQQVGKRFKGKTIVESLSYQVSSGKVLALCGGNGAGKSTLIRMIVGMTKPTKGLITINGWEKGKNKKQYMEQIGYMPDDFHFQPKLTAQETLRFYAKLKRVDNERIEEVLELVGLTEYRNKQMGTFSKGMKQRMLLAQTLLTNPPVLILDEPTNGLDPYWVHTLAKMMKERKKNGQTIISTHDLLVAEEVADEVIILYNGKVLSKGNMAKYQHAGLYKTFQQLIFNEQGAS